MIYLSTGAFQSQSPAEIAAECAALGVGVEFTSSFRPSATLLAEVCAIRTPGAVLIHNYFPPPAAPFVLNLAATDPAIREASMALCRTAIGLSAEVGAPFYSVHAGFAMNLTPAQLGQPGQQAALDAALLIAPETALAAFTENVRELSAVARAAGIGLLLENNVITAAQVAAGRADSLLLTTPAETDAFFQNLADPNCGLLLDVAHAKVAARALGFDPREFFRSPHLRALHLSDNDGTADNNRSFTRESWFMPELPAVATLPIVIEVYGFDAAGRRGQVELLSMSC